MILNRGVEALHLTASLFITCDITHPVRTRPLGSNIFGADVCKSYGWQYGEACATPRHFQQMISFLACPHGPLPTPHITWNFLPTFISLFRYTQFIVVFNILTSRTNVLDGLKANGTLHIEHFSDGKVPNGVVAQAAGKTPGKIMRRTDRNISPLLEMVSKKRNWLQLGVTSLADTKLCN